MSAESLETFLDAEPHGLNGPSGGGVELGADIQPPPRNSTPETDAQLKTFTSISKHKRHFTNRTGTVSAKFARKLERERDALDTKCKQLSSQLEDWQNFGKYSVEVIRMCVVAAYPEYRETMRRFAVLEAAK